MGQMRLEAESRLDGNDASEMTIAVLCLIQELQEWNLTGKALLTDVQREIARARSRQWVTWVMGIVTLLVSLATALEVVHLAPKL